MRKTLLVFFLALIVGVSFAMEKVKGKIYVEENKVLGIMVLHNTFNQAIFCVRHQKGKVKKFYIQRNSKSAPFPTTKFWCAMPDKKV